MTMTMARSRRRRRRWSKEFNAFNNTSISDADVFKFGGSKDDLFKSFSDLCFFDEEDEEFADDDTEQKEEFLRTLAEFMDEDDVMKDKTFAEAYDMWHDSASIDDGKSQEEIDVNVSMADLFDIFTDMLTNDRTFTKDERTEIVEEMERLQSLRRRMAGSPGSTSESSAQAGSSQKAPSPSKPSRCPQVRSRKSSQKESMAGSEDDDGASPRTPKDRKRHSSGADSKSIPPSPRSRSKSRKRESSRKSPAKSPGRRSDHSSRDRSDNDKSGMSRKSLHGKSEHRRREKSSNHRIRSSSASPVNARKSVASTPGVLSNLALSPKRATKPRKQSLSLSAHSVTASPAEKRDQLSRSSHSKSPRKPSRRPRSAHPDADRPRGSPRLTKQASPRSPSRKKETLPPKSPRRRDATSSSSPRKSSQRDSSGLSKSSHRKSRQKETSGLSKSSHGLSKSSHGLSRSSHPYSSPRKSPRKSSTRTPSSAPSRGESVGPRSHLSSKPGLTNSPLGKAPQTTGSERQKISMADVFGSSPVSVSSSKSKSRGGLHNLRRLPSDDGCSLPCLDHESVFAPTVVSADSKDETPKCPTRQRSVEVPQDGDSKESQSESRSGRRPSTVASESRSRGRSSSKAPVTSGSRSSGSRSSSSTARASSTVRPQKKGIGEFVSRASIHNVGKKEESTSYGGFKRRASFTSVQSAMV